MVTYVWLWDRATQRHRLAYIDEDGPLSKRLWDYLREREGS